MEKMIVKLAYWASRSLRCKAKRRDYRTTPSCLEGCLFSSEVSDPVSTVATVAFWHFLGNDITILNGRRLKFICSQCGYWGSKELVKQ